MLEITQEEYKKIKYEKELIKKSRMLVEKLFKEKYDKSGIAYINHLLSVASCFKEPSYVSVALLHDTLEDTQITKEDLVELGYPKEIIEAVDIITRKEETYPDFINRILKSKNDLAIRVKQKDMENNMDEERLKTLDQRESDRLREKYKKEYEKICQYIEKEGN